MIRSNLPVERRRPWRRFLFVALLFACASRPQLDQTFDRARLREIDARIERAIAEHQIPGGVLWIERNGVAWHRAYGNRALVPAVEKNSEDTIYDAASITKVIATAPSIWLLIQQGKVTLDAPVKIRVKPGTQSGTVLRIGGRGVKADVAQAMHWYELAAAQGDRHAMSNLAVLYAGGGATMTNFAEAAREMLVTGDYRRVQIGFQPFAEKPPLFMWIQALSMRIFGVGEFAARLPNALVGIIALVGMIIRNSVILIDQIGTNVAAGQHQWNAVIDAANHRLRPILLTAAAQLTTLPLLVYNFRQFSLVALLANFVILPAQPALEVLSGLALLLGESGKPVLLMATASLLIIVKHHQNIGRMLRGTEPKFKFRHT